MNEIETRKPRATKRMVIMLIIVGALFALVIGFNGFKGKMMAKFFAANANPPQTVSTMPVAFDQWQPQIEAVGTLRALHGADLALDVAGLVDEASVISGSEVHVGQVLLTLRAADDRAKLTALQAQVRLAELTAKRSKEQLAVQAVSQAQYDTDMASLQNAKAQANAQAALLDKKTLQAPFAGRIGIITVNPGDYLSAGTKITTLQQLDSLYVDFTLPQSVLNRLRVGDVVSVASDAIPGESFAGTISATDPKVDPTTRNIAVEARVANTQAKLLPGMFVSVAVLNGAPERFLTLPQTAITFNPYGDTVFVVHPGVAPAPGNESAPAEGTTDQGGNESEDAANTSKHYVEQVLVTTGNRRGDQVAILKGLQEGDIVVSSGGLKLKNGTPVTINNAVQPVNDSNPKPSEQ